MCKVPPHQQRGVPLCKGRIHELLFELVYGMVDILQAKNIPERRHCISLRAHIFSYINLDSSVPGLKDIKGKCLKVTMTKRHQALLNESENSEHG